MLRVSSHVEHELNTGWELATLPAGAAVDPRMLAALAPSWLAAQVPGTVASALRAAGRDVFRDKPALDADDHFYRCRFALPPAAAVRSYTLTFEGLATLAECWLNGEKVLESDDMFLPAHADVTALLRADNELLLRFRALDAWLAQRRPRPRWRTRLVDHAQLRWARTSLLGRMPGWSPPVHAVGPWRPVRLICERELRVEASELSAELCDVERSIGRVKLRLALDAALEGASAELWVGEAHAALSCGGRECSGELELPVQAWWPHTHGAQPLYPAHVLLRTRSGQQRIELGALGFRRIELDAQDGGFVLRVNGVAIFCRGACWTTTDVLTLCGTSAAYARDLERARDAGMNMLRISGSLFYEADEFYRRCDELGILVWQDFMFANMDYPTSDAEFLASVSRECEAFLRRTQSHACLGVLCGGSEVEQQAAMLGLPRAAWRSNWFDEQLPALVRRLRPDVPYWPNTPSGGDLPFEVDRGSAHYYGVGAYLRPLDDARRCQLQFAAECLAFANLPDDALLDEVLAGTRALVHDPRWKERVPRDVGASWDFEDVRDHYLGLLFACEPAVLRKDDCELYLARSRVVTGEVMQSALCEWRRARSSCGGALIWFYRDLWPGAGLGLLDAHGRPKAALYYVRRALLPTCLWFTDEGLNGLHLHLAHESSAPLSAELRIEIRCDATRTLLASHSQRLELAGRSSRELHLHALLPGFADLTRAYRFGPPAHDLVLATLLDDAGAVRAEALYLPDGPPRARSADVGLRAELAQDARGEPCLRLSSERLAYAVALEIEAGYEPEDNYLHVPPGAERWVRLRPPAAGSGAVVHSTRGAAAGGTARALNSHTTVKFSQGAR